MGAGKLSTNNKNPHIGHRERVRARYLNEGGESFEDHQILELILFSCIPQRDTNELAHNLIDSFGSLFMLLEANPKDIMNRCGVSDKIAIFLSAQNELVKRAMKSKLEKRPVLKDTEQIFPFAKALLAGMNYERFFVICLDSTLRYIHSALVAEGTVREAMVYPRKVVEAALRHQSSAVILTHNHPGGSMRASMADISITTRIVQALNMIGIVVVDHIIIAGEGYYSFSESGMIKNKLALEEEGGVKE